MTTITKEQVEDALKGLWITSESCNKDEHDDTVRGYISQLEADNSELNKSLCQAVNAHQVYMDENPKRQPVSDEKLREAVRDVENTNRPASDCGYSWPLIKDAISELETLRAAGKWRPIESAPTDERILIYYDNGEVILCDENDNDGFWVAYEKDNWCDTPKYWMPLPTPPAQEV